MLGAGAKRARSDSVDGAPAKPVSIMSNEDVEKDRTHAARGTGGRVRVRVDDSRGSGSGRDSKRRKVKSSEDCDEEDAAEDFSYEFGPGSFERTARLTQEAVNERLSSVLGTGFELRFSGAAYPSQDVTDAVRLAVKLVGDSTDQISGRSMRRGGITTARQAGVPEDVVNRQSGHGMRRAGRD